MNRLGDDVMIEIVERIFHIVSFVAAFDLLYSFNKGGESCLPRTF